MAAAELRAIRRFLREHRGSLKIVVSEAWSLLEADAPGISRGRALLERGLGATTSAAVAAANVGSDGGGGDAVEEEPLMPEHLKICGDFILKSARALRQAGVATSASTSPLRRAASAELSERQVACIRQTETLVARAGEARERSDFADASNLARDALERCEEAAVPSADDAHASVLALRMAALDHLAWSLMELGEAEEAEQIALKVQEVCMMQLALMMEKSKLVALGAAEVAEDADADSRAAAATEASEQLAQITSCTRWEGAVEGDDVTIVRLDWLWDGAPRSSALAIALCPDEFDDLVPTLVAQHGAVEQWSAEVLGALRATARERQSSDVARAAGNPAS
jgi:hypothetical protein